MNDHNRIQDMIIERLREDLDKSIAMNLRLIDKLEGAAKVLMWIGENPKNSPDAIREEIASYFKGHI